MAKHFTFELNTSWESLVEAGEARSVRWSWRSRGSSVVVPPGGRYWNQNWRVSWPRLRTGAGEGAVSMLPSKRYLLWAGTGSWGMTSDWTSSCWRAGIMDGGPASTLRQPVGDHALGMWKKWHPHHGPAWEQGLGKRQQSCPWIIPALGQELDGRWQARRFAEEQELERRRQLRRGPALEEEQKRVSPPGNRKWRGGGDRDAPLINRNVTLHII